MPRLLKYIESGALYFISTRTEDGLPFIDATKFQPIFCAVLARAQHLHPVKITGFWFGANQFHLGLVAIAPDDFYQFIGYLKQELAHICNQLRGRRKKTVWCEGYDSPVLLGYEEAVHYHTYLYCQAQEAYLVDKVEEYKGACSWKMFSEGVTQKKFKRVYRVSCDDDSDTDDPQEYHTLTIEPYCWLKRIAPERSESEVKEEITTKVRDREAEIRAERLKNNIKLNTLKIKPEDYVPKKFGKRMMCICWDIEYRKKFLSWIKEQVALCKEAYQKWKSGARDVSWPLGFFAPSMPRHASLIPISLNL